MYEDRRRPLISVSAFTKRVGRHLGLALAIVGLALACGLLGYHFIAGLSWIDSLLDASMILGGMGPVSSLHTVPAKLFASCYALFSGLVFIGVATLIIAPFAHRVLHRFHLDRE